MNTQLSNTKLILTELLGTVQKSSDSIDFYFDHVHDGELLNPFMSGEKLTMADNELLPREFFRGFGINTLILDTLHGRLSLSEKNFTETVCPEAAAFRWSALKNDLIFDDLKMLFKNTQIVEFADWSEVRNATDVWDNLRRDVIMPAKRDDFNFIFDLGDTIKKFVFDADEMLDIMSDYTLHGAVTLFLDQTNVTRLWQIFHGRDPHTAPSALPGLSEQCRLLYDLMDINHLIVDTSSGKLLFSTQQQFELASRRKKGITRDRRKNFNIGYMLGLILNLDILHAIIWGESVSDLCNETDSKPSSGKLIGYLKNWILETDTSFNEVERQLSVA